MIHELTQNVFSQMVSSYAILVSRASSRKAVKCEKFWERRTMLHRRWVIDWPFRLNHTPKRYVACWLVLFLRFSGAAIRATFIENRHLVSRRAGIRSANRLQPIRRRHKTRNVSQHIAMWFNISGRAVSRRFSRCYRFHSKCIACQSPVSSTQLNSIKFSWNFLPRLLFLINFFFFAPFNLPANEWPLTNA